MVPQFWPTSRARRERMPRWGVASSARVVLPAPVRRWVRLLARAGFLAKAAVYVAVGLLAAKAAVGWGGRPTDTPGAIAAVRQQPGGALAAAAIGLGLLAYAAWQAARALADTEHRGRGAAGLASRGESLVNALVHLALALSAFAIALGLGAGPSAAPGAWTARALRAPAGAWLVGLAGLGFAAAAVQQLWKAAVVEFEKDLAVDRMGARARMWMRRLGRFGVLARGLTFGIIGVFLVRAARHADPGEARNVGGALRFLQGQEHGALFLGVVALGLVSYGLFALFEARYRRIGV
jgi:hypothetical protein